MPFLYHTSLAIVLFFFLFQFPVNAQFSYQNQELKFSTDTIPLDSAIKLHSPSKAAILSAIVPGLGQAYNKKYWKTPIAIGGLAVCVYFLKDNLDALKLYKQNYLADIDDDSTTINTSGFAASDLETFIDRRKRWRDLSYLSLAAVYVINILDAYVDGHLYHFDVGENITLYARPSFQYSTEPAVGISLALKF